MAEELQEEIKRPITLAFKGFCKRTDGKKGTKWQEWPEGPGTRERIYNAESAKHCRVGSIYTFDEDGKGAIYVATRRFTGQVDTDTRVAWEAAADEEEREKKAREIEEAHKEILKPLRDQYKGRVGYTARAAYLAKVITYITG